MQPRCESRLPQPSIYPSTYSFIQDMSRRPHARCAGPLGAETSTLAPCGHCFPSHLEVTRQESVGDHLLLGEIMGWRNHCCSRPTLVNGLGRSARSRCHIGFLGMLEILCLDQSVHFSMADARIPVRIKARVNCQLRRLDMACILQHCGMGGSSISEQHSSSSVLAWSIP